MLHNRERGEIKNQKCLESTKDIIRNFINKIGSISFGNNGGLKFMLLNLDALSMYNGKKRKRV